MSAGHWIVSRVSEPATAHDTEAAANRAADGVKGAVVWWCSGVAESAVFGPVSDSVGEVAPVPIEVPQGPQIEDLEIA